jgi:hypothetical protein
VKKLVPASSAKWVGMKTPRGRALALWRGWQAVPSQKNGGRPRRARSSGNNLLRSEWRAELGRIKLDQFVQRLDRVTQHIVFDRGDDRQHFFPAQDSPVDIAPLCRVSDNRERTSRLDYNTPFIETPTDNM